MSKNQLFNLTIFSILLLSCSIPHRKLNEGKGNSVPRQGYNWINGSKFDSVIYKQIDPNFFYELTDEYWCDNKFNKVKDIQYETLWKKKLQFYQNGRVRRFATKFADANPEITGNRGIIYKNSNYVKIDFMEGESNNRIVINTYTVQFEGAYIYMFKNSIQNEKYCSVFKKSNAVEDDYKLYAASW